MLKITQLDQKNVKLFAECSLQFPEKYSEPYMDELCGIISRESISLKTEMTFKDYLIVGTMEEKTALGELISRSSASTDVKGLYKFHIIDKNKIELKIVRVKPVQTTHLKVNPFTYTLTFVKDDDY